MQLCAFAGEEQGLVGSRAYARKRLTRSISGTGLTSNFVPSGELRDAGANLTLMVQADMLAYHKPGEPPQLGLPDRCVLSRSFRIHSMINSFISIRIGTPEVSQLVANLSAIYSPELHVGITAACCSDHQVSVFFIYVVPHSFLLAELPRAGLCCDPGI